MALMLSLAMTLTLLTGFTVQAKDSGDEMGGYLWTFFNASTTISLSKTKRYVVLGNLATEVIN